MNIRLRNNWENIGEERWNWEVYLDSDNPKDLFAVKEVKYILHPTFSNPIRVVRQRKGGFKLKTSGWGIFLIKAFVYLLDGEKIKLEHMLELHYEPKKGTSP
ncbi:MAG: hypothetical protein JAZ06_14395 [Candidatus Thiodiazotropha taylori]|nr:hypothetical protein [Candidatus Thiodiazotropha taylori]